MKPLARSFQFNEELLWSDNLQALHIGASPAGVNFDLFNTHINSENLTDEAYRKYLSVNTQVGVWARCRHSYAE